MAKRDAIFDYSSHFDSSSYTVGMQADWDNNASNHHNDRMDIMWSGDPSASPGAQPSGWGPNLIKGLSVFDIALDASAPAPNEEGFQTTTHKLIYDIKRAFNLPNQENLATWKDEYTTAAQEHHLYMWTSKDLVSFPMTMAQDGFNLDGSNNTLCALEIGVSGFERHGGNANEMSYTVRPTSTNVTAYNAHYQTQVDNSTAAADFTSPPQVGSQFSQVGNIILINYENHWQPTDYANADKDELKLLIAFASHSYAQIKALMDAAIA